MKSIKIIISLFCLGLTMNAFKNGIPIYNKLALYAEFIPVIIVFIIGILLLKSAFNPEEKKDVILVSSNNKSSSSIEQVDKKIQILDDAYNDRIIEKSEYDEKKEKLLRLRKPISTNNKNVNEYKVKKDKITELFNNDIISKEELEIKIDELEKKYNIDRFDLSNININSKLYYISKGNEYGPVSIGRIAFLIENNELNPNCFIRLENESSYSKRANEIIEF